MWTGIPTIKFQEVWWQLANTKQVFCSLHHVEVSLTGMQTNHFCSREIDVLFTMHELTMHVMAVAHSSTNMATSYKEKQQLLNRTEACHSVCSM
jgi:hypothetical protein